MSAWPQVRLGDCAEIISGSTPKTSVPDFWDGDVHWATPKDLSDLDGNVITSTARRITAAGLRSCGASVLPPESVLFSSRAPIGLVAVNSVPMATNQGFKSFVPRPNLLDSGYLAHWLRTNRTHLDSLGNGATFKEVSKAVVSRVEIPLPPIAEQRRIAEVLDRADALLVKRRESLVLLDDLTQSIFLDMFGNPVHNPKEWPRVALGDLASRFSDGPFGSNLKSSHYRAEGVRVVRLQNVGVGHFIPTDEAYISEDHFAGLRKHECLPGDVLVGTLGDPNLRACVQPESLPRALNKADCVQIRPDSRVSTSEYLCALINSPGTLEMAQSLMLGQTRVRISMGRLRGLELPRPPLELQEAFSKRVRSIADHEKIIRRRDAELAGLFASLRQRAFAGDL